MAIVHGDDFFVLARRHRNEHLAEELKKKYDIEHTIIGQNEGDKN